MEFEKKRGCGNCKSCCCLFLTLVIGFLGVAVAVLFGVLYYQLFIDGNFVSIRGKIAELEKQLNQSQAAVSTLRGQVTSIPSDLNAQVQNIQAQLNQAVGEVSQANNVQAQEVSAQFMQTLSDIRNVEDLATDVVNQYTDSSAADFASASSLARSDYSARSISHVEARVPQLSNFSASLIETIRPLPINIATQRTTYTRWGNSTCPDVDGTTLVYSGYAGGSVYWRRGGGANIVCLPMDPELNILPIEDTIHGVTQMYGSEYESGFLGSQNENVPCAVCSVSSRSETIMIPAKVSCPTSWTREYYGYLMAENINNFRTTYTCVDEGMEFIPGRTGHADGCDLWLVEPSCTSLPCPPYDEEKELACVVCSR